MAFLTNLKKEHRNNMSKLTFKDVCCGILLEMGMPYEREVVIKFPCPTPRKFSRVGGVRLEPLRRESQDPVTWQSLRPSIHGNLKNVPQPTSSKNAEA